ncbi:MAG: hypothetical protein AB7T22_02940 [Calditrichaceae bacterium]
MKRLLVLSSEHGLVEDFQSTLDGLCKIEVTCYQSCCELMEGFLTLHTDMIMLDIDLLKERVTHLINVLKLIKNSIVIILILSEEHISICKQALPLGIHSYLIKPVSGKELFRILDPILQHGNSRLEKDI